LFALYSSSYWLRRWHDNQYSRPHLLRCCPWSGSRRGASLCVLARLSPRRNSALWS